MSRKVHHALHRLDWRSLPINDPGATLSVENLGLSEKSGTSDFKATHVQVSLIAAVYDQLSTDCGLLAQKVAQQTAERRETK